ncbi:MAG TPA: hypothetical protein VGC41_14580, partial [Kofleriaceae bacterium]
GEPAELAREHARVRSPFGARLSRVRAYSAAALLVPLLYEGYRFFQTPFSPIGMQLVLGVVMFVALIARLTWARAITFGGIAFFTLQVAHAQLVMPQPQPMWIVPYLGVFLFVMPWRRREIASAGWALALNAWTFAAASFALMFQVSTPSGYTYASSGAIVAFVATAIAATGTVLRARWASLAAAIEMAGMGASFVELAPLHMFWGYSVVVAGALASGFIAALIAAGVSWKTARSVVGTWQHVFR